MTAPSVSVIIVSHGRPDALCVALTGVGQLNYPSFEIVIVADAAGVAAVRAHPLADQVKIATFDTPNISAARNAGIALAASEIIAFIDDDAVPEPDWLTHLTGPFADPKVAVAGGYVIGRNGISFQWKARTVGPDGQTAPLKLSDDAPEVFQGTATRAIKTEGTNMALRRDVLVGVGGFDPAFAFYLDETDLNMRLGQAGHYTAIVPSARVHHGFAASGRRRPDRVPTDLTQIGASLVVFLRKHGAGLDAIGIERAAQCRRLLAHMVAGRLLPSDVKPLLAGFDDGCAAGMQRDYGVRIAHTTPPAFAACAPWTSPMQFIVGRSWTQKQLEIKARAKVQAGQSVTIIALSPTAIFHRVRFDPAGFWLWTGGQFGKADRSERLFQMSRMRDRAKKIITKRG